MNGEHPNVDTWRQEPFENEPDDVADEEMSYRTDDGDE